MFKGRKIALIDDESSIRHSIKRLLISYHMDCMVYDNSDGFFNSTGYMNNNYLCVLCDLHLPGRDGFETLKKIIEEKKNLPVIIITGYDSQENRDKCFKIGCFDFLNKPIDEKLLIQSIENVVNEI